MIEDRPTTLYTREDILYLSNIDMFGRYRTYLPNLDVFAKAVFDDDSLYVLEPNVVGIMRAREK